VRDEDCATGWVCGADNQCRDPAVAGPNACADDRDCGGGWRCGVAARCVDPAEGRHTPADPSAPLTGAERVSPASDRAPDRFSFLSPFNTASREFAYALTKAEGAQWTSYAARGGDVAGRPFTVTSARSALPAPASAVVATPGGLGLALVPGSGLYAHGGSGTPLPVEPRLAGLERLSLFPSFSASSAALLIAWGAGRVGALRVQGDGVEGLPLAADGGPVDEGPAAGGAAVREVAGMRNLAGATSLAAVTDRGLYARELAAGRPWLPVAVAGLSHGECAPQGGALRAVDVVSGDNRNLVLVVRAEGAGPGGEQWLRLQEVLDIAAPPGPCSAPRWGYHLGAELGPCALCPEGGRLVDVVTQSSGTQLHSRCELPAAGGLQRSYTHPTLAGCSWQRLQEAEGEAPVTPSRAVREQKARVTDDGRYFGEGAPLLLHQAPQDVLRLDGALTAAPAPASANTAFRPEYAAVEGFGLARAQRFGLARPLPAGQEVSPRYVVDPVARAVREVRDGGVGPVVATLDPSQGEGLRVPVTVDAAPRPDGGTTVVLTSFDLVLSADVSAGESAPGLLSPRLSPSPLVPIRDTVLVPPGPDALAEGYALTDNALFYVRALSDAQWRSQRVQVAAEDAVAIWRQGAGARVGYRSGAVYALPGRLQLAPPLPGGETVSDYAGLCGRTYAATSAGLRRLEPAADGTTGSWVQEARFSSALPSPPPLELAGARLFVGVRELFWGGGRGTVLRFPAGEGCPP
jgi:hypothetical protein